MLKYLHKGKRRNPMKWKTVRSVVDNKVRGYDSVDLVDGRSISISRWNTKLYPDCWSVHHPRIEAHKLDNNRAFFSTLAKAKEFAETLVRS